MKAMVCSRYGPPEVFALKEVPDPLPRDDEVLIRLAASSATAGDAEIRRFELPLLYWLPVRLYYGLLRPRRGILGQEFAGEVVRAGRKVERFQPGDAVFGVTGAGLGAYAELIAVPAEGPLALKPENLAWEEAATLPTGGLNALHFLRAAGLKASERLLVYGAGGGIGTAAIQLARAWGARVAAVDAGPKLPLLRELGAETVFDYRETDFTASGEVFDVVLDVVGRTRFGPTLACLSPTGRYVLANPDFPATWRWLRARLAGNRRVLLGLAREGREEMETLAKLAAKGAIRPVVDRTFPLEELAAAHRYVESGEKQGNVALSIRRSGGSA